MNSLRIQNNYIQEPIRKRKYHLTKKAKKIYEYIIGYTILLIMFYILWLLAADCLIIK